MGLDRLTLRCSTALRRHGVNPALHVLPPCRHFSLLDQHLDERSAVLGAVGAAVSQAAHAAASGGDQGYSLCHAPQHLAVLGRV